MKSTENLFPQGLALGNAFCNRSNERAQLVQCFLNNEHTVLVAPRRYGKSSLIKQSIIDAKLYGRRIDLLPATNIQFVNKAIQNCCSELMSEMSPKTKKAKEGLIQFVHGLHPKITLKLLGQQLEISSNERPEQSVIEMLLGVNTFAKKINQRAVICFDEFQQIGLLKNYHSIEASIRHAVESSDHVSYVFSGSSRHLLSQMFNTKSRPLYHLCDLMEIDRIKKEDYIPILKIRAKNNWREEIELNCIEEVLNLTKCHPYYVNALCRKLWKLKLIPNRSLIQKTWLEYIENESNWISDDLARLSPNQRNIIAALAYTPTDEPYGNDFCHLVKMGASSINKSLDYLINNDFVYKTKDGFYRVLDPAVEAYLLQITAFDFISD